MNKLACLGMACAVGVGAGDDAVAQREGRLRALPDSRDIPVTIDGQSTMRMTLDTLCSLAVIDVGEGAPLVIPEAGEGYGSAQIVKRDHDMNEVFVGGGRHALDIGTFDTPCVLVIVRTLVDACDSDDVAAVNALQDGMSIGAASSKPFILPGEPEECFKGVLEAALELDRFAPDTFRTVGPKTR